MAPEGSGSSRHGFYAILTEAVADMSAHGFDSVSRLAEWQERLTRAAEMTLGSPESRIKMVRAAMEEIYRKMVERGGILVNHEGVSRFTIERMKPKLRAELDRRILASADLVRLNRDTVIRDVLQRFTGWASSIPAGGTQRSGNRTEAKDRIRKSLANMPFLERRVVIDQGHKLVAAIDDIIAKDEGAIAAGWHSKYRQPGYDYRPEHAHRDRDGQIFLIRGSWAHEAGLVKSGANGYTDQIDQPGEKVNCGCRWRFHYSLRHLPQEMLTKKGREKLAEVAKARAAA